MRRIATAVAAAAILGVVGTAVPASASSESVPGLKAGTWTCVDTAAAPLAALETFKGNKYAVDGGDKGKYVYKVGQKLLKFKTGAFADLYNGSYDKETKTITLHNLADGTDAGTCTRDEAPVTPVTPAP